MRADLSTGDLARATGNTVRTVRFYEEQGLLRPTQVSGGGHRRYTEHDLDRLRLIADLRELGLPLSEIKAVLDLRSGCETAGEFATRFEQVLLSHIDQARERMTRLERMKSELEEALLTIQQRLSCESASGCPCAVADARGAPRIVKVLAESSLCEHQGRSPTDGVSNASGDVRSPPK